MSSNNTTHNSREGTNHEVNTERFDVNSLNDYFSGSKPYALHGPGPVDDNILNAARWSGSERKMAKVEEQVLRRSRQRKAMLQRVFDAGVSDGEATEIEKNCSEEA